MSVEFYGEPELKPHADGFHWTVEKPYLIRVDHINIVIAPGFISDLGSIPKIFWNVIPPVGKPLRAYLGHDWLYAKQIYSRRESDLALWRMMAALNVPRWQMRLIYWAVYCFGGFAWRSDAKKKEKTR